MPRFSSLGFCKILLSIFVIYHVLVIAVLPNGNSFIGRRYQNFFLPYANTLVMNTSWNFFSPDPANTMYIHYVAQYLDEQGNETRPSEDYYFPEEKEVATMDITRKRDLYLMRFLGLDPSRIREFFIPWVCKEHKASSIFFEHLIFQIPSYEEAMERKDQSVKDLLHEIPYVRERFSCDEMGK